MKSPNPKALTTRLFVALALTAVSVAGLSGLAEAATCYTCHAPVGSSTDLRPVESTYRNITTGSIRGSHLKHIPAATTLVSACAACHGGAGGVTSYTTKHRNGNLDVPIVGYSRNGFAQTGNPVPLGTCSTASCHVTSHGTTYVPTPTWGVTSGCVGCHTGAGAFTGTGLSPNTGSHTKHLAASATCGSCHTGAAAGTSGGNAHVDGNIDVAAGYAAVNVTKHAAGGGYSTCSNAGTAACHASPYGTATITTTVWGVADCAACHVLTGAFTGAGASPTTGSHTKHQAALATCAQCHSGASAGISGGTAHIDGNIDVTGSAVANYTANVTKHAAGTYGGSCSTTCHSTPYTTGSGTSPSWGTASAGGCASCHNGVGAFTSSNGPSTGSHTKHMSVVVDSVATTCASCHVGATAGVTGGTGHLDTNIDVLGYAVGNVTKHAAGSGYGRCSTASCHEDPYSTSGFTTTPTWGVSTTCGECHVGVGAFTGTSTSPTTGSHSKHQAALATCAQCHAGASTGFSGGTAHIDGNIDVAGSAVANYTVNVIKHAPGTYSGTCTTSCHTSPYTTGAGLSPAWGSASNGCALCHNGVGAFTSSNGPTTGSHTKHMTPAVGGTCASCHAGATAGVTGGTGHLDSNIDVVGYPANVAKHAAGSGYARCSTASCHANPYGTGYTTSPTWGVSATCGECHTGVGSFTGTLTSPTTGSHTKHQSAGALCSQCHAGASAAVSGGTAHIDGDIDVVAGYSVSNVTKHAAGTYSGTCNNASCHASPYATTPALTPTWGAAGSGCANCHTGVGAFTGTGSSPTTGSHTKHQATVTCAQCHAGASAGISGGTAHVDTNIDVTGSSVANYTVNVTKHAPGTYSGTCSTTCHATPYATGAGTSGVWGSGGAGGCAACHNGQGAFTNGFNGPATGGHTKHGGVLCSQCHAGASAGITGGSAHNDTNIDVTGTSVSGYTVNVTKHAPGTYVGTCTTTCHSSPYSAGAGTSNIWGSSAGGGCSACHNAVGAFTGTGLSPNTGSHSKHMGSIVNGVTTKCGDCHTGASAGVTGGTGHLDSNVDVNGSYPANVTKHAATNYTGRCSTATCHADPYSPAGYTTSPTWGVVVTCGECHVGIGSFTGTGSAPITGSHTKHMAPAVGATCASCHVGASAAYSGGTAHIDGNIDVLGYATSNITKHAANTSFQRCSTASCHADPYSPAGYTTSPTWGAVVVCGECHVGVGAFSGIGSSPTTGSHSKHQASGYACSSCHTGASAGISGGTAHNDGNIDVIAGYALNVTKHAAGSGYGICNNASCHANPYGTVMPDTPVWGAASAACVACHTGQGAFTNGFNGPTTGGHTKHGAVLCSQCHASASAGITGGPLHADGNIDVTGSSVSGYTVNVTKHAPGTYVGTCTTTCHSSPYTAGAGTSGVWGSTAGGGCAACHNGQGAFSGTGSSPISGSHTKHMAPAVGGSCASCHAGASSGVTGGTGHLDSNVDVIGGYPANVTKHAFNSGYTGRCSSATCHADPYSPAGYTTSPTWGAVVSCGECHVGAGSFSGTGTSPTTGSHSKHNGVVGGCGACHSGASAGISGGTAHIDTNIDVSVSGYTANVTKHAPGTYSSTCSTTCHASPYVTGAGTSLTWGVAGGGCGACHTGQGAFTNGFNGPATGAHTKHGSVLCAQCHAGASAGVSGGTAHNDTNVDVTGSSVTGYTANVTKHAPGSYVGTCTTACHASPYTVAAGTSLAWGATGGGCGSCHSGVGAFTGVGSAPSTGSHSKHMAAGQACGLCHTGAVANVTGGVAHGDTNIDVALGYTANVTKHTANTGYPAALGCNACHGTVQWGSAQTFTCLTCHNGTKPKTKGTTGTIRQITGAGGDFVRLSRHVTNGTATEIVTKWDCVVCHMEGDSGTGSTSTYHSDAPGLTNLRNVDSPTGSGFSIDRRAMTEQMRTDTDLFCLACHDADGAKGINVNATNTGVNLTTARALMPFNSADTLKSRDVTSGRTRVIDVKTQFFAGTGTGTAYNGNPSQHAVLGQRYWTKNAGWASTGWVNHTYRNGTVANVARETAQLHCSDCHLNETNAHGAANAWHMLLNGTANDYTSDTTMGGALISVTASTVCFKCHVDVQYNETTTSTTSRNNHANQGDKRPLNGTYGQDTYARLGSTCGVCHAGGGWGNIHGMSGTYSAGGTLTKYRFFPGSWLATGNNTGTSTDADFTGTASQSCYSIGANSNWSQCNSHTGAATNLGAGYSAPAYTRGVKY